MVSDIQPGAVGSNPIWLTNLAGILYFTSQGALWKSDGTVNGTVQVAPLNPASTDGGISHLKTVGTTLFFKSGTNLRKIDNAMAGSSLVMESCNPIQLTNLNGTLFFTGTDSINGTELWKSDGTSSGTLLIRDITPGTQSTYFQTLVPSNNLLFLSLDDGSDRELWRSDGTSSGTHILNIRPSGPSNPADICSMGGSVLLRANDGVNGYELWKSDGTSNGTILAKDIWPSGISGSPAYLQNVNGTVFFRAQSVGTSAELWKSDGTSNGTVLVKDIRPGTASSGPRNFSNVNGTLFFRANDGINGNELWRSDGTSSGTFMVRDIFVGAAYGGNSPREMTDVNGTMFFCGNDGINGFELWKSDGTSNGTVLVKNINPIAASDPDQLVNVNGTLFFRANDGIHGAELWMVKPNSNPQSISLSGGSIAENQPSGSSIGSFSTSDADVGDVFVYSLVSGAGDSDNSTFSIIGNQLFSASQFDFETKSSFSIRVRTTDLEGAFYEAQFAISVTDGNDAPTQVSLTNVVPVLLSSADTSSAIRVADVSAVDDGLGTNLFSLSGADSGVFELVAGQLRLKAGTVLNYATQKSYTVTVTVDDATVGGSPDASVNFTLSLQGLEGITVQNGTPGRSYLRNVDLNFSTALGLDVVAASVGTASPRLRLFFAGTTGTQLVARNLTGLVSVVGNTVKIDFGANGVGGDRNSSLGDGVYRLRIDLSGDGNAEFNATFFRLFGDVDGNGIVNDTDIQLVTSAQGLSGLNLATDLNGDTFVNSFDLTNVKRRKGAKVVWS
jgi:ELWxxDGT repeat protein